MLNVSEDTVTYWENNRAEPQIHLYPRIIDFLGYNPFPVDISTLGGRIYKYRVEQGISQKDLGKILGVDEGTIYHWEKNIHSPLPGKRKALENLIT